MLIEVAFKGNRKEFFLWDSDDPPPAQAAVIVEADRGEDLGHVYSTGELAVKRNAGTSHGSGEAGPGKRARRLATAEDEQRLQEVRGQDEDARRKAMERVRANQLAMKLSDAEWQWDRKKLTFYFTAEKRVDFRNLVRELAAMFRTRIELKQIGVRDEAKRLDGIGRCGRQYCSSSWLPELRPVNLGVAKDQRLSLNPSQISGACGRLMCCLRYEHEFYVQQRKRFPKEGKILRTTRGEEKVIANDIFRERVTLRGTDNEIRVVPLAELRVELGQSEPEPVALEETASADSPREQIDRDDVLEEPVPARTRGGRSGGGPRREDAPAAPTSVPPGRTAPAASNTKASPPAESETTAEEGSEPRKPHRRRGRRGGRRNRAREGGRPGDAASPSPSAGDDS